MKRLLVISILVLSTCRFQFGQNANSVSASCSSNPPLTDISGKPSWNGWGADNSNTRHQPQATAGLTSTDAARLKLQWAFGFPGAKAVSGQPTIVAGRIFVSADNSEIYSLDSVSGCVYWSYRSEGVVRSSATVGQVAGRIATFFGDARSNVYALDATTGIPIWKVRIDDHPTARITGALKFFEERLYVPVASGEEGAGGSATYECCTFRGSVVALNAASGRQLWKTYTIPDAPKVIGKSATGVPRWAPSGAAVWNSPTIDSKRRALYVGTGNAYSAPAANTTDSIIAMDLDSGKILWSVQESENDVWLSNCIGQPRSDNCGPDHDFGSPPILKQLPNGSAILIAGQKSGNVWAHDPDKKGAVVWKTPLVSNTTEFGGKIVWGGAADDQNAYFGLGPGGVAAVQLGNGEKRWFTALQPAADGVSRPGQDGSLTSIPGAVLSGGWDGVIRMFAASDGRVLWEFNTIRDFQTVNGVPARGGSMGAPGPVVAGGLLLVPSGYVGVRNGVAGNVLLAFSATSPAR